MGKKKNVVCRWLIVAGTPFIIALSVITNWSGLLTVAGFLIPYLLFLWQEFPMIRKSAVKVSARLGFAKSFTWTAQIKAKDVSRDSFMEILKHLGRFRIEEHESRKVILVDGGQKKKDLGTLVINHDIAMDTEDNGYLVITLSKMASYIDIVNAVFRDVVLPIVCQLQVKTSNKVILTVDIHGGNTEAIARRIFPNEEVELIGGSLSVKIDDLQVSIYKTRIQFTAEEFHKIEIETIYNLFLDVATAR